MAAAAAAAAQATQGVAASAASAAAGVGVGMGSGGMGAGGVVGGNAAITTGPSAGAGLSALVWLYIVPLSPSDKLSSRVHPITITLR